MATSKQLSGWDEGDYEQIGSRIGELAVQLVDTVERRTGELTRRRVLDLACGTGNASLEAARRGALVTGTDLAEGLLRQAAAKARTERLDVEWQVADAADTGLPAAGFDVVMSSVGLVMLTEHAKAIAETARLLTPGGIVAWTAWRDQPDNPFGAPMRAVLPDPDPAAPSVHDWSDNALVEDWLADDFVGTEVEEHDFVWRFSDVETAMRLVLEASPMHLASLRELSASEHELLRHSFWEAFAACRRPDGSVEFANPYVVVSAIKA